jgi:hypothetical protein
MSPVTTRAQARVGRFSARLPMTAYFSGIAGDCGTLSQISAKQKTPPLL